VFRLPQLPVDTCTSTLPASADDDRLVARHAQTPLREQTTTKCAEYGDGPSAGGQQEQGECECNEKGDPRHALTGPWEGDPLGRNERFADVEPDLCVGEQRNPAGVAGEETPVEERGDGPVC
jgi:hypothetical protein